MSKRVPVRSVRSSGGADRLKSLLMEAACSDSLAVSGYSSLIQSPDVASAVQAISAPVSNATIHLMKNTADGDVRVRNELSKFMDINPYSLGTRQTFVDWIVTTMLTSGDGNAYALPMTNGGYLEDLVPMVGAYSVGNVDGGSYIVRWKGRTFFPDEVLHFVFRPDLHQPWRGRGVRIQLRDVLQNLRQSAATTNSFLSDKWKPSVIVKVDALADEFAGIKGRRKLLDEYVAGQTAGEPWVIPSELMDVITVKPLSLADLAINDSVELDKRAVAAAFAVPPFLVGVGEYDQDAYNNFIQRTVIPIANGIAQELTKKLLVSTELYFKFNTRKLYAYDYETLAKIGDDQYVRGIMTGNEVRDWLDLSPKKGLNELVMLENYIPAGMIGQQKKLKEED